MPTTAPAQPAGLWTPSEVLWLVSGIVTLLASVLIPAVTLMFTRIIRAVGDAKAEASRAITSSEHNARQVSDLQNQVVQVALNSTPPGTAISPVVPATFTDAAIRAASDPGPPAPPAGWVPAVPAQDRPKAT